MTVRIDVDMLRQSIDALFLNYPELADDEQLRADMLEGETDIDSVLARLVNLAADAGTMQDAIKLRMSAMAERKARYERQEDAMRSLIISVMDRASLSKFVLPEATLSLRMVPPAPIVTDADLLTDDCVRIERKPDMKAIKALMESNGALPGVAMSNGRQSLTIRTK